MADVADAMFYGADDNVHQVFVFFLLFKKKDTHVPCVLVVRMPWSVVRMAVFTVKESSKYHLCHDADVMLW